MKLTCAIIVQPGNWFFRSLTVLLSLQPAKTLRYSFESYSCRKLHTVTCYCENTSNLQIISTCYCSTLVTWK